MNILSSLTRNSILSRRFLSKAKPSVIPFEQLRGIVSQEFPIIDDKRAIKLLFKEKININNWGLEEPLDVIDKKIIAQEVLNLNPEASFTELFSKKPWNIDAFNKTHLPTVLGQLKNPEDFSKRDGDHYFLFMDMPIKLSKKGWQIPVELSQYREVIKKAAKFERLINPNYEDYNVYITVDQREVEPGKSQRRTGWHADSYINVETRLEAFEKNSNIETDSIYLVSDSIPTEFCKGPFPFIGIDPNNTEQVLNHFENIAKNKDVTTYPPYTLVRLGPECIHQVGLNQLNKTIPRTFLKITFSRQILNREGNGVNRLFDINWPMFPRSSNKRNHSTLITGYLKNIDHHRFVHENELQTLIKTTPRFAKKKTNVSAYLATPNELLQTVQDDFITCVNTAKAGDWKITSISGTEYFLSSEQVDRFYLKGKEGQLMPKDERVLYVQLKEPIQFMAPWKTIQYLRAGDYLIQKGDEIYGVLRKDFEMCYQSL